jgi:putative ABC transport system permease protein
MNLVHVIIRQWRQRPARTVLSVLSVAIAVAAVFGVALAQGNVRLGYRNLQQVVEGRPSLEILPAAGGRFEPEQVPSVADIPGVFAEIPVVTRATLARVRGKRLRTVLLGVPVERREVWETLPIAEGQPCRQPDEALLAADVAKSLDVGVGDRVTVLARPRPRSATIVGLVNSSALREFAPAATLVLPLKTVQELFGLNGQVDRIRVLIDSSERRQQVQSAISARLPKSFIVQAPVNQMELADSILRSTELALRFAGGLTLAMAAFIILNTLRMNFGERRHDVAVLRVLGVTPGQLARLHLLEGTCLGLIGSILGIPLGVAVGRVLGTAMQRLVAGDIAAAEIPYWALPAALVIGPSVACAAALLPALQSRKISPVEALGDPEVRRGERFPLWAVLGGVVSWLSTAVVLALVVLERLSPEAAIPAGVLMLVAFIAIIPALLRPLLSAGARLLSPWARVEGEFATQQLLERPTRTGLTIGVLVAAISTSLGLGNAIMSNVNDVRAWYRRTMAGDVFLMGATDGDEAHEGESLRDRIAKQPGVDYAIPIRNLVARANGLPAACIVRDFAPQVELPWDLSPAEEAHLRQRLRAGEAALGSVLRKKLGLHTGDTLRLELQGRVISLRVGGLVRDYTLGGLVVFLDEPAAAKMIDLGPPAAYVVRAKSGTSYESLVASLQALAQEEGLIVRSFAQLRRQVDGIINGIVGALWGLLAIGFVIGGVAVGNTLTMSVLEQTRELGLLRIIGMTRGQAQKLVFCESLLLGLMGTLIGVLSGLVSAWVIHLCNEPLMGQSVPFALHGWLVAANVGICLAITLVAAWSPGRRAARLDLLTAIAYE